MATPAPTMRRAPRRSPVRRMPPPQPIEQHGERHAGVRESRHLARGGLGVGPGHGDLARRLRRPGGQQQRARGHPSGVTQRPPPAAAETSATRTEVEDDAGGGLGGGHAADAGLGHRGQQARRTGPPPPPAGTAPARARARRSRPRTPAAAGPRPGGTAAPSATPLRPAAGRGAPCTAGGPRPPAAAGGWRRSSNTSRPARRRSARVSPQPLGAQRRASRRAGPAGR